MTKLVFISEAAARLIDQAFLPTNPNKLRKPHASREQLTALVDACWQFKDALKGHKHAPAPVITGRTFTRTIWTCTTDGDNCSLTTTVHANEADAIARVRRDLESSGKFTARCYTDGEIADKWTDLMDGACIIEPHNIEVEA